MASTVIDPFVLDLFVFAFGLIVGSFLNVLALRTLAGVSIIWPPSRCSSCEKSLPIWDNIPLVSYILLKGKCRFCHCVISWQYPVVELVTALSFLVIFRTFAISWQTVGYLLFVSTLITVTVTDIAEKLIPHDITYPSMLVGIGFSSFIRHDLAGTMAGIGASYILFDFIAHYGLKLYTRYHAGAAHDSEEDSIEIDSGLSLPDETQCQEEIEVMGGGDAVLAAVISAYLGWQRLAAALLIGFLVGTVMGISYLLVEMRKANLLKETVRPALVGASLGFCLVSLPIFLVGLLTGLVLPGLAWLQFGLLGAAGGGLLGIVSVGQKVSKPFPFGPALAAGGAAAIFWDPVGGLTSGGA